MTASEAHAEPLFLQVGDREAGGDHVRIEIVGRTHSRASSQAAQAALSGRVLARAAGGGFRAGFAAEFHDLDFAEFTEELQTVLDGVGKKRKIGATSNTGVASFYTLAGQAQILVVRRDAETCVAECVLQHSVGDARLSFSLSLSEVEVRELWQQSVRIAEAYPSAWNEEARTDARATTSVAPESSGESTSSQEKTPITRKSA